VGKARDSGVSKKKTTAKKAGVVAKREDKKKKEEVAAEEEKQVEEAREEAAEPFDITQHFLVPKHEILSEEEKNELLKRYGIQLYQLPYIAATDPIVKKLGAKIGDIIKITRESETAGRSVYYRVVVREVL